MTDFRYILDGQEIEAYQITDETRYQQKQWPEWLDSRDFLTIDGMPWLQVGNEEIPIPQYGWIIVRGGVKEVVGWQTMENAEKVVPDVPKAFEEEATDPSQPPAVTKSHDDKLLTEVTVAYELLKNEEYSAAEKVIRKSLSDRTEWCNCTPGNCQKVGEKAGCREHSPLLG